MKKTKLMKIYLMCVCVILSCVACSSADKNETTTTHVEAAGNKSTNEETTGVSENQATSNDNESSNEETAVIKGPISKAYSPQSSVPPKIPACSLAPRHITFKGTHLLHQTSPHWAWWEDMLRMTKGPWSGRRNR